MTHLALPMSPALSPSDAAEVTRCVESAIAAAAT